MSNTTNINKGKTYNNGTGIKSDLLKRFKAINEYDRYQLLGVKKESDLFSAVRKGELDEDTIDLFLTWYEKEYVSPFWTGDILKEVDTDSEWIVTCIYTDGSIDLIPAKGTIRRENIGTMGNEFIKVGSLEVIMEHDVCLETLLG